MAIATVKCCRRCGNPFVASLGHYTYCGTACRFWAKVDQADATGCWFWRAFRGGRRSDGGAFTPGNGHGHFGPVRGRNLRAHRLAWELVYGPVPDGMYVLHRCDRPACCNPLHLFLGTQADNVADMVAKGRHRALRGEANGRAKLTADQVRAIRASFLAGRQTATELARAYGVTSSLIHAIVRRYIWRSVD